MTVKHCSKCELAKPYADFPKGRDSNGLYYICKSCLTARTQQRYKTMDKLQRWVDHTLSDVKSRSKRNEIAFSLTKETLYQLFNDQQGKCAYCDMDFVLTNTKHAKHGSPSIDRLVPSQGYTERNVALCCHRCNAIKQDATPTELQTLATAVLSLFRQRGLTTVDQSTPSQTV